MNLLVRLNLVILLVPTIASAAPIELKHKGKLLDPYCFNDFGEGLADTKVQKIKLDDCSNDNSIVKQKIEVAKDGSVSCYFHGKEDSADFDGRQMASYNALGKIGFDYVVSVTTNGGGTGYFNTINFVRLDKDYLYVDKTIQLGDRCNAGLEDASVKDGKLLYSLSMTSSALVEAALPNSNPALNDSALGCVGSGNYVDEKLVSIDLGKGDGELSDDDLADKEFPAQQCFDKLFNNYTGGKDMTINLDQLKVFVEKFKRQCNVAPKK